MWRLLPILAILAFLEVLVPWPDVAALVLTNASQTDVGPAATRGSLVEMHRAPSQLLVQARETLH
jgi:hypothetical protein